MITREQIEQRLAQLHTDLAQLQANQNAYLGAIQDCEHWLEVLSTEAPVKIGEGEEWQTS